MTRGPVGLVVGAGPAGLMAADEMARAGLAVTIIDHMPSVGRKFLMAGRGGLNLTHSEPRNAFLTRYGAAAPRIAPLLEAFSPEDLRAFAQSLGQETFVGTSGRVFPRAMKASPMLRAWLARLRDLGVTFRLRARFAGFAPGGLRLVDERGEEVITADAIVLALGGASWPRLGADGGWAESFRAAGIDVALFRPANCGVLIDWSAPMRARAGEPLKRIALSIVDRRFRGDAVITRRGLEGGPVYALSPLARDALARGERVTLDVDLRPDVDAQRLAAALARGRPGDSLANALRKATGLAPAAVALLREAGPPPREPAALAAAIKQVRLPLAGVAGLERAISTAGGVRFDELDDNLMLKRRPGVFIAGEMLDWEAPTGGYLLQACFSSGYVAGRAAAARALAPERTP
ncbi:MAG: TIGR03862 family flavoprotein [Methylobacteriaceae bacterium]|nr:TIGR03862 family flavoprotein [Methylobacteriaceae bacterium]